MKKEFLKLCLGLAVVAMSLNACTKPTTPDENPNPTEEEFLAPMTPQNRVAVLEDFTGVRCVFCPDGHVRAQAIKDAEPNKFIIIATHGGGYATPAANWPNFTTIYADALISQSMLTGYPAGTINRIKAEELGQPPMKAGGYAMGRGSWSPAAAVAMNMSAPVNLGVKATANGNTVTIKVDAFYTAAETVGNNLNVAILQDNVKGKQITPTSGSAGDPNYIQNNVLRTYLTGQWGESIPTTAAGTKYTKTYTYEVPEYYNGNNAVTGGGMSKIDDMKVVVFITQGQTNILNAVEVDIK